MADVATAPRAGARTDAFNLVKRAGDGVLPGLDKLATDTAYGIGIARLLEQAGSKKGVSTVLLSSLVLGIALCVRGHARCCATPWGSCPGSLLGAVGALPGAHAQADASASAGSKSSSLRRSICLSRAIKAGHAFQTAMGMVADDGADPMGPSSGRPSKNRTSACR